MANKKITDLTAAAAAALTDLVEVANGNPDSQKASLQQIQNLFQAFFATITQLNTKVDKIINKGLINTTVAANLEASKLTGGAWGEFLWNVGDINNGGGFTIIDLTAKLLGDASGGDSLRWDDRQLIDGIGSVALNWTNTVLSFPFGDDASTPTDPVTVVGYLHFSINGTDSWVPYYR